MYIYIYPGSRAGGPKGKLQAPMAAAGTLVIMYLFDFSYWRSGAWLVLRKMLLCFVMVCSLCAAVMRRA